jgi:hypothetical protein
MTVKWHDHRYGGGADAKLGPGLVMTVSYSMTRLPEEVPKWDVDVFGNRLKGRCQERDEAMRRAERVAKQILGKAMEELL